MNPSRMATVRLTAGYLAIASALPYLALKVVWLSGGTLGVADLHLMRERSMVALNAITAGMDLVGIFLALAFTHRWGLRIPAWLLLPPMWVATGLLARFVAGVPIVAVLSVLAPELLPDVAAGPVDGWVYAVVYVEFAGLGFGLIVTFLLYASTRWTGLLRTEPPGFEPRAADRASILLANAVAPAAIGLAALHLAWAFGATVGLGDAPAGGGTIIGSIVNGIDAVLALAAAAGVLLIVHRLGENLPGWLPAAMAWTGTGSLFGWGLWQTVNVLAATALVPGSHARPFVNLVGLLRLIAGLVLGIVTLFVLAGRHRPTESRSAP